MCVAIHFINSILKTIECANKTKPSPKTQKSNEMIIIIKKKRTAAKNKLVGLLSIWRWRQRGGSLLRCSCLWLPYVCHRGKVYFLLLPMCRTWTAAVGAHLSFFLSCHGQCSRMSTTAIPWNIGRPHSADRDRWIATRNYLAPLCLRLNGVLHNTFAISAQSEKCTDGRFNHQLLSDSPRGRKIAFVAQVTVSVATTWHSISGQHNDKSDEKKKWTIIPEKKSALVSGLHVLTRQQRPAPSSGEETDTITRPRRVFPAVHFSIWFVRFLHLTAGITRNRNIHFPRSLSS